MGQEAAIQSDAAKPTAEPNAELTEEQPVVVEEAPVLERDNLIADVIARRKKQRDADISGEDRGVIPVSDPDTVTPGETPPVTPTVAPTAEELVELKVNGQQVFKTAQEVEDAGGIPAIQKQLSGEMKLQAAATRNQSLDQRELNLNERERQLGIRETTPAPTVPAPVETDVPSVDSKALAEDLVVGDTDKVAAAIDQIIATRQPQQPQPQQPVQQPPVQQIDREALKREIRNDLSLDGALEGFARDFSDIYDHPGNKMLANEQTVILGNAHPDWSPAQILTEAGKRTRAILKIPAQEPAPEPSALERKQQIKQTTVDQIPQASSRGTQAQVPEHRPKSKAEIFAEMEANRSH